MKYVNTTTAKQVTEAEIKASFPNTSFPIPFEVPDGYAPLVLTYQPDHNPVTHQAREITPVLVNGSWQQAWEIVSKFTQVDGGPTVAEQEAAALAAHAKSLVPKSITMRQAKLVLLKHGMLDEVNYAVSRADEETRIEWEYATEVRRDWTTLAVMAAALNLNDQLLDALFIQGATL